MTNSLNYENPLTFAVNRSTISYTELGADVLLSKQYLGKAKTGCYSDINDRLIGWIARTLSDYFDENVSTKQVNQWYHEFQIAKRNKILYKLSPVEGKPLDDAPVMNDYRYNNKEDFRIKFVMWRRTHWKSGLAFAQDMCIHPYTVQTYEEGGTKDIPGAIMDLLVWIEEVVASE